jgi:hypothetical protein
MEMQINTDSETNSETILPPEVIDLKLPLTSLSGPRTPKPERAPSAKTARVKPRRVASKKAKPGKKAAKTGSAGAKRKRKLVARAATPASAGSAVKLPDLSSVFNPSELEELRLKSKSGLVASSWKWLAEKLKTQQAKKRLRVCETVALGEKRFIAVVQVDDQQFLVGGSSSAVSTLAHLERPRGFAAVFQKGLAQSVNRT